METPSPVQYERAERRVQFVDKMYVVFSVSFLKLCKLPQSSNNRIRILTDKKYKIRSVMFCTKSHRHEIGQKRRWSLEINLKVAE
jgi:hypothetical protein